MLIISILLFIIYLLFKRNIISYTSINIFNNTTNNNTLTRGGLLFTSIFIFILYILEKLFYTEYVKIASALYLISILLYCITVLLLISFSFKKRVVYLISFCIFSLISILFYKTIEEPRIEISYKNLKINSLSSYYIELKEIDSVWISDTNFNINKKINGIDLANYYRGKFIINNRKKPDLLIINKLSKPFIHLKLKDNTQIIFNNTDKRKTINNLYNIKQSLNKKR
jgi:hypothetical protein